jgi:hypothetical protein
MALPLSDPQQLLLRAPLYELAFTETRQALDSQERTVSDITTRAGVLMAATAVTTSVFGGQVLSADHRTIAAWLALAAFVGVAVTFLTVLWPRRDWEFHTRTGSLLATYAEPMDVSLPIVHRDLAIHRAASFGRNREQIARLHLALRAGMCLLALEVAAWVVALTGLA